MSNQAEKKTKIDLETLLEPYYKRLHYEEERIKTLADSIKEHGLLQNIGLKKTSKGLKPVFGTRRIEALRMLGVKTIPSKKYPHITLDAVRILDISDFEAEKLAHIENEHRRDWSGVEKALSWNDFMEKHGLNQEDMARIVGKSQSYISQKISLLQLPKEIQNGIITRLISDKHGGEFLRMQNLWKTELETNFNQVQLREEIEKVVVQEYKYVVENNLSSRELRERINSLRYCLTRAKICCIWTKDFENEPKLPEQSIGEMLWKDPDGFYTKMAPCDFCNLYCLDSRFWNEDDMDFFTRYSLKHRLFPQEVSTSLESD